ncbi:MULTISPECIES: hypothetical protein [unclassified Microcoleus]
MDVTDRRKKESTADVWVIKNVLTVRAVAISVLTSRIWVTGRATVSSCELEVASWMLGPIAHYSSETRFQQRCFVTKPNIFVETGFLSIHLKY